MEREKNRESTWREGEASDSTATETLAIALLVLIDCFIPISFLPQSLRVVELNEIHMGSSNKFLFSHM